MSVVEVGGVSGPARCDACVVYELSFVVSWSAV